MHSLGLLPHLFSMIFRWVFFDIYKGVLLLYWDMIRRLSLLMHFQRKSSIVCWIECSHLEGNNLQLKKLFWRALDYRLTNSLMQNSRLTNFLVQIIFWIFFINEVCKFLPRLCLFSNNLIKCGFLIGFLFMLKWLVRGNFMN